MQISQRLKQIIVRAQKKEITEYLIYKSLARSTADESNRRILEDVAADELRHHAFWQKISGESPNPSKIRAFLYVVISRVFGLTFGLKLMERGEIEAKRVYNELLEVHPEVQTVFEEEERHEQELIGLINEDRLKYISSMVLGLNDALVELTGALAGLTLALQQTRLIAVVGIITGIAASMSMAASEYLSTKQEETEKDPVKASVYTGFAYIGTVIFLVVPYLLVANVFICLALMMVNALLVIVVFTFYISIARDLSFGSRFREMAAISLGIAVINFFIGLAVRHIFNIE